MNVLKISPGYPVEQPYFTNGLASIGHRVIGIGDQPEHDLPALAKQSLAAYFQVSLGNEQATLGRVAEIAQQVKIDQVECTWEPYMILAAQIRQMLRLPGMTVDQTIPFRDKEVMKRVLDQYGIRTPHHYSTTTKGGVKEAAQAIGFPICVKPIAGAGSADTYRVDSMGQLDQVLNLLGHVAEVSVEEFVEADEFTFDTVCINGEIKFFNICQYRPRPLIARQLAWISPQTITIRNVHHPYYASGVKMGYEVIKALGFQTGFTHMEWYRKADGEAVFGEIAARPPGANTVDIMNFSNDFNIYRGWAEAVTLGTFSEPITRRYHAAHIFKRAQGEGRIQRIDGIDGLMRDFGEHIMVVDLLPIGTPRRDWKQTLRSDGMLIVRHPDLNSIFEILDQVGSRLQIYAG